MCPHTTMFPHTTTNTTTTHIGSAIDKEEFYAIYGEMLKVRKKEEKKKEKAPLELKSYGMLYYFTSGARIDERTRILRNI